MTKVKSTATATATAMAAPTPTPASAVVETKLSSVGASKPSSMHIVGPMPLALAQAVVHIRNGYTFSDLPIQTFGASGNISFHLELGNPDQDIIKAASASFADALALEAVHRQTEIEAAAARLFAQRALAEEQALIAAEIAEQEEAMNKLRQAMAASKAKLV